LNRLPPCRIRHGQWIRHETEAAIRPIRSNRPTHSPLSLPLNWSRRSATIILSASAPTSSRARWCRTPSCRPLRRSSAPARPPTWRRSKRLTILSGSSRRSVIPPPGDPGSSRALPPPRKIRHRP
jgi:hypothetical protein